MLIAHQIALAPNNVQATYFARAAGTARFAYNWALAEWQRQYQARKADASQPLPSQMALRRQLNSIKGKQFPWMLEVTKNAPQMAIIQLGAAFKNFFAGRAKYPKFRKKGIHDRFSLSNEQFSVDGSRIRIPKLGWVRMRETLRFTGKIMSATVSRVADKWFVSITVDTQDDLPLPKAENQGAAAGVDLGVSALATLYPQGCAAPAHDRPDTPVSHYRHRGFERARYGQEQALVACRVRYGFLRVSTATGLQSGTKAAQRGGMIVVADRWYPSSKMCSDCGHKLETLPLTVREWVCPACGSVHDRDVNAAINLKNLAVSSTVSACGEAGSGLGRKFKTKPASVKQESSSKATYG